MDPISLIVIGILFGTVVLIIILYIGKTIAERKSASITKEVFVKPETNKKTVDTTDNMEEIAVIMAAIEAFTGGASFKIRQIIDKKSGSLIWHQAGVNQNNISFD